MSIPKGSLNKALSGSAMAAPARSRQRARCPACHRDRPQQLARGGLEESTSRPPHVSSSIQGVLFRPLKALWDYGVRTNWSRSSQNWRMERISRQMVRGRKVDAVRDIPDSIPLALTRPCYCTTPHIISIVETSSESSPTSTESSASCPCATNRS